MSTDHDVEVEVRIAAPPEVVYDLVADVTQMGRWSLEIARCRWLRGATGPAVGARFRGTNQHGWRRWSTTCTVTEAEPGERFAFAVTSGPFPVATWAYVLSADAGGTIVQERWREQRAGWFRSLTGLLTGVSDRPGHNRETMEATLQALRTAAEGSAEGG